MTYFRTGFLFLLLALSQQLNAFTLDHSPASVAVALSANLPPITLTSEHKERINRGATVLLKDVLPRGTRLSIKFRPGSISLRWHITCSSNQAKIWTSTSGDFNYEGRTLARNNTIVTTTSLCPPDPGPLAEKLNLPATLASALSKILLSTPVDELIDFPVTRSPVRIRPEFLVNYLRKFTQNNPLLKRSDALPIFFGGTFQTKVNSTYLDRVTGSSTTHSVSGSPRNSTNIRLGWRAEIKTLGSGSAVTISSTRIEFRSPNGSVLGHTGKSLTRGGVTRGPVVFNETVSVPAAIVQRIRNGGYNRIDFVRIFTDGGTSKEGKVSLPIGGAAGADLQINRIDLRFLDGSSAGKVFPLNSKVEFEVELNYFGKNLMRGICQWAGPVSAGAIPFYRNALLKPVFLMETKRTILTCPAAPSSQPGIYYVRFHVVSPELSFDEPFLRYAIGSVDSDLYSGGLVAIRQPLFVTSPAKNGVFGPQTRFAWQAAKGDIEFYKVEIFSTTRVDKKPITGIYVQGDQNAIALGVVTRTHLLAGKAYWWRILAVNKDGKIVAESSLMQARTP